MSHSTLVAGALVLALAAVSLAVAAETSADTHDASFAGQTPPGWEMSRGWVFGAVGAKAEEQATAVWQGHFSETCWFEVTLDLPSAEALAKGASLAISVGPSGNDPGRLVGSGVFSKSECHLTLAGVGADTKPLSASAVRDTRPSVLRELNQVDTHTGWAEHTVTMGLALHPNRTRLLVNGCVVLELPTAVPSESRLSLVAQGLTVRSVHVLRTPPIRYLYLTGSGVAALSGGLCVRPLSDTSNARPGVSCIEVAGIPMLVQHAEGGLACLDVAAERWKADTWSEGKGFLRAPVPARPYAAAHILLHRRGDADKAAAMGVGLRPLEMCAGDLRSIYLDALPTYRAEEGVTVTPARALGENWYLARVPLNPAALQWYTHDPDGNLLPLGAPSAIEAYFCRPWINAGGLPQPGGKPSSLSIAAVTLEESAIDLTLHGNGLGNVYAQPEVPHLKARVQNLGDSPVAIRVSSELIPFGRPAACRIEQLELSHPGETRTIDALTRPVDGRGHYRVRVVADAGPRGCVDYRTNIALLAPNTRRMAASPFGCWAALWMDESTDQQRAYLKEKAGIAFLMGKHNFDCRMGTDVPSDAAAEAIVKKVPSEAQVFMLGWEHTWTEDQTFAFPQVITEGTPETLSEEIRAKVDKTAADWRRLAAAIRRLRPDLKISLGNSAVNFSVPLLQRGFKPGVEFDYLGTEEGLFDATPEQPADAIGNISWWAKAVCSHFGYQDVPLFHSESVYYPSGPAFSRMAEATQAGNYVRMYLLGYPYRAVFGLAGAMVDSSNRYAYSQWGTSGYCNRAPECSPKLSYVAFATLTQLLDGARYDGTLDTGSTSLYALRFQRPDKSLMHVIWNLRGSRLILAELAGGKPEVVDALNRPLSVEANGSSLSLTASELPLYLSGCVLKSIAPGPNLPEEPPCGPMLATLDDPKEWTLDLQPDKAFEAARSGRGVVKVRGKFDLTATLGDLPLGTSNAQRLTLTLHPLAGPHPLIPRYVTLRVRPGGGIPIPKGTTRLGLWVRGNSTWGQVKLGIRGAEGRARLLLEDDPAGRMVDNFDGWRFLDTGDLGDDDLATGEWSLDRIVITMAEKQVYVDQLCTTRKPEISLWGLRAIQGTSPVVNYLPW